MTDDQIVEAVAGANIPPLLMVVYQFSGDEKWLGERYQPAKGRGLQPREDGGLPVEVQAEIREAAVAAIRALRDGETPAVSELDAATSARLVSFFLGLPVDSRYGPLLGDEIKRRSYFERVAPAPTPVSVPDGLRVIVVGLGLAGLAAINMLQSMGIDDYVVFERGNDVGGVWAVNKYPGAGVDTPSHLYSFSFAYRDWSRHFELRDELHQYFSDVLDQLQARSHVRYETEVLRMRYDDSTALWTVHTRTADGTVTEHTANIVISAVGALNQPRLPVLPGMDTFEGQQFHSTNWPDDVDLHGKRVAVVGVGASSQQISPQIAPIAQELTIFQRSPQWVAPFDLFRKPVPEAQRRLLEGVPLFHAWAWVEQFWQFGDTLIDQLRVDPSWPHLDRSVNERNEGHRRFFTRYIEEKLQDRPDLLAKVVPDYPPFGKRILLDNGWYDTLKRENVSLVTEGVVSVDATGLIDSAGTHHDVDVIIWATGFQADHFLESIDVYGEAGLRLRDAWGVDDPRAYLGLSVPHFPNFFMIGGPHSFPGSGSVMYVTELQTRYLREVLRKMFDNNITAIAADEQVTDNYNKLIDDVHDRTVWTHRGFSTYYRNSKGRVVFIMPFTNLEFWEFVQNPDLSDYAQHTVPFVPAGTAKAEA